MMKEGFELTTEGMFSAFIRALPEPHANWPEKNRKAWLDGMAAMFELVYTRPDPIRVQVVQVLIGKLHQLPIESDEFNALYDEIKEQINEMSPKTGSAT